MEHRLIVTADDFGACDYIDNGIKEAIQAGVVSSVAAFINFEPRVSTHPHGAYKGSIAAIQELIKDINQDPLYKNNRKVRIGLHLNFHAGSPVYPHHNQIKNLLHRKKRVQGKPIFKTIEQFDPGKMKDAEVIKELYAQYSKFYSELGFAPDHLSSHFPILFMTPRFFESVCMLAKPLSIPIRNPFLIWQTKNESKTSPNKKELSNVKRFFRKHSQTKELGIKRAIRLIDTLNNTLLSGYKRKNIAALKQYQIPFADYINCHMYGNGANENCVNNILSKLLSFHPEWYEKKKRAPIVTEMVTHVGKGTYKADKVPSGIDAGYFEGRRAELNRITDNKMLKRKKLYNYKSAFE